MFLDEKIDKLKQLFTPADFKVPFTEGSNILKAIEAEFISSKDLAKDMNNLRQHYNRWPENIKNKIELKVVDLSNNSDWLNQLDPITNYWTVLSFRNSLSAKYLVYDCKPKALAVLFSITQADFFVIDKKYRWFSYFQVDNQTNKATIFKSGEIITPFEV